jgi:hypothetical protein
VDGDFDNDNDIDLADYNSLAMNFSPAGYGGDASAVPEPTTMMLSLFALLSLASIVARYKR